MRPFAGLLSARHEVVLPDIVGHGESDAPTLLEPYRMSSVVDQLLAIVGDRAPMSTHLVGYSMGGRIALSMAARAPWFFASVTTLSATGGLSDPGVRAERHEQDLRRADRLEETGIAAFIDEWLDQDLFAPLRAAIGAERLREMKLERSRASPIGLANSLRGTGTGAMPPVWDRLASLRCPLLAVCGALDPAYVDVAEQLSASAGNGSAITLPGLGHALPMENPDAVARAVLDFLEGCPPTL
jgi:2-succinyl-6-hydroxy-2,4-cyclohexadiene-1-carboxylate synthase